MGASPAATGQMTLRHLVETAQLGEHGLISEVIGEDAAITDVTHDSRQVSVGTLFCCVDGENEDGHAFAQQAIRSGATALLVDHVLPIDAPQVVVRDVRMSMGLMAAALRNFPCTLSELQERMGRQLQRIYWQRYCAHTDGKPK
jgi:UDP-N-acetylmuramyl pentapeptide synthase